MSHAAALCKWCANASGPASTQKRRGPIVEGAHKVRDLFVEVRTIALILCVLGVLGVDRTTMFTS
jgi:hypothetical protein